MIKYFWRQPRPREEQIIPDPLSQVLIKRWPALRDYSIQLDINALEYLRGLADCEIEGAEELIILITKYGVTEIYPERF